MRTVRDWLLLGAATIAVTCGAAPAGDPGPDAPPPALQLPGVYRFSVGDVRVTVLSDGTVPIDLHKLLLGTTPAEADALLRRSFLRNPVEASINAFLLDIGPRRVLVDTGSGDLFGPGNGGKLPDSLAAAGVRPEAVTDILLTHVHTDHSGGLVRRGRMMFPAATVHVGKPDVDFFLDPGNAARTGYDKKYFTEAAAMLGPYVAAGKVKALSGPAEVVPGVTATLHPGHTPGSAFYRLESRGRRVVFIGDTVHVAAVQFPRPDIAITFDVDPKGAARVRADQFPVLAGERLLVAAPHTPFPGVGHVREETGGGGWGRFTWVPVEYGNRGP